MRVLRTSAYSRPDLPPTVIVARDCDTTDTLESIRISSRIPDLLVLHDLFEMEDGDEAMATFEAGRRITPEVQLRERHQVTLYFYLAQIWQRGNDGAVMMGDELCPLEANEMANVFEQLAQREDYRDFRLIYPDRHGTLVTLAHGEVSYD